MHVIYDQVVQHSLQLILSRSLLYNIISSVGGSGSGAGYLRKSAQDVYFLSFGFHRIMCSTLQTAALCYVIDGMDKMCTVFS